MIRLIYLMLTRKEPYRDPMVDYDAMRGEQGKRKSATRSRLQKLFPLQWREPPVSPGEPTGLNQERSGQCNEAPEGVGYQS